LAFSRHSRGLPGMIGTIGTMPGWLRHSDRCEYQSAFPAFSGHYSYLRHNCVLFDANDTGRCPTCSTRWATKRMLKYF
jgi:hypothetical protein